MISKYATVIFPYTTIIPYHLLHGHRLFHLVNPDPVETETVSNPNPKNSQYPAGLNSKIRILYTTVSYSLYTTLLSDSRWIGNPTNHSSTTVSVSPSCLSVHFFHHIRFRESSQ